MRTVVWVFCLAVFLVGCTGSGAPTSLSPDDASASTTSPTGSSSSSPVTNSEGETTGDPYAQCEITQSTAQPDPPNCVGNPDFEWERAPTVEPREGGGWLTEGVILSNPDEPYITVGFRLSEECVIDRFVVEETDETVTVGLHYWAFDDVRQCADSDKKWALRGHLDAPLGEREFVVRAGGRSDKTLTESQVPWGGVDSLAVGEDELVIGCQSFPRHRRIDLRSVREEMSLLLIRAAQRT